MLRVSAASQQRALNALNALDNALDALRTALADANDNNEPLHPELAQWVRALPNAFPIPTEAAMTAQHAPSGLAYAVLQSRDIIAHVMSLVSEPASGRLQTLPRAACVCKVWAPLAVKQKAVLRKVEVVRYCRVDHPEWGFEWGEFQWSTVLPNGCIWVAANNEGKLLLLSATGTVLRSLAMPDGSLTGSTDVPIGVAANEEFLYISGGNTVEKMVLSDSGLESGAAVATTIDGQPMELGNPCGLELAGTSLYVVDNANKRIVVLNASDLVFVNAFTCERMQDPFDIAALNDELFVANGYKREHASWSGVLVFSTSGEYLRRFEDLKSSTFGVCIASGWVIASGDRGLAIYSPSGHLQQMMTAEELGNDEGFCSVTAHDDRIFAFSDTTADSPVSALAALDRRMLSLRVLSPESGVSAA